MEFFWCISLNNDIDQYYMLGIICGKEKKWTLLWISIISDLSPLEGEQVCNGGGVCELLGADCNRPPPGVHTLTC